MSFLSKIGSSSSSGSGWGFVKADTKKDDEVKSAEDGDVESDEGDEVEPDEDGEVESEEDDVDDSEEDGVKDSKEAKEDGADELEEDDDGVAISPIQSPQQNNVSGQAPSQTPTGHGIIIQSPGSATPQANHRTDRIKKLFP